MAIVDSAETRKVLESGARGLFYGCGDGGRGALRLMRELYDLEPWKWGEEGRLGLLVLMSAIVGIVNPQLREVCTGSLEELWVLYAPRQEPA